MSLVDRFAKTAAQEARSLARRAGRRPPAEVVQRAAMAGDRLALSKAAPEIKLASLNMHNMVPDDPRILAQAGTRAKTPEELRAMAKAIRELDADVVGVQEVYDTRTLRAFLDEYVPDMGYRWAAVGPGADRGGRNVGVFSRLPILRATSHPQLRATLPGGGREPLSRPLFQATVRHPNGYEADVFVIHLKSSNPGPWREIVEEAHRRGMDPEKLKAERMARAQVRREAEAQAVRDFLVEHERRNPERNFVLLGDSNQEAGSRTYRTLRGLDDPHPDLTDPLAELPADTYTFLSRWHRSRIDVVQMSPAMDREYVRGSAHVLDTPAAQAASDHRPPSARIFAADK